ncbi:hypothetical protein GCM10009777_31100 [Microbacterium pumilum]|uniref:Yip1 domain-containing protein n=1 Tax=Microbacterium pumilum TaxID=344165 RepID=A0ABN2SVJ7_9MICO
MPHPPNFTAPYPAPGSYAPPPGYAGPYLASPAPVGGMATNPRHATGAGLGLVALLAAIAATVISGIAIVIAAFNIGLGAGREIALRPMDVRFDWSALTPVRDWVLVAEVSFWIGTALGVWAIIQGIVAIAKNRGRGLGVAAIVVAALGLIVFVIALQSALTAGLAAGTGIGG